MRRAAALVAALLALACTSEGGHIPAPEGTVAAAPATVLAFHERADAFYQRLIRRRFNALETFNDPVLRGNFRSVDLFFDYYATLATEFNEAHFEKSRPVVVNVEEFIFESPTTVQVQVRFEGYDDRPWADIVPGIPSGSQPRTLRPTVTLFRLDRWERHDARWWLTPAKL